LGQSDKFFDEVFSQQSQMNWKYNYTVRFPAMMIIIIIFNLRTAAFKAYRAIWVRRSNFRHEASPRESTQR
jgi:hypothetical protein